MNRIKAVITAIESYEGITVVGYEAADQPMGMMALDLDPDLRVGMHVILGVKASNIAIAKAFEGELSITNRLETRIEKIVSGELLCSVMLRFDETLLESVITRASSERMALQKNDRVSALIKASDLSVLEVVR